MMKHLFATLLFFFAVFMPATACTTAIISGKYTVDGRPLLYKHRDTNSLHNKLMSFSDGRYNYVGIVNSQDETGNEVWGGYNSTGFAIMNSASYNLNADELCKEELEGVVMKLALQRCATLEDFERLLDSLPKPMCVSANFGVIDAHGGAAYYETGDFKYIKYDANDDQIAPMGYIIRTNYSFSGDRNRDRGTIRYQAAAPLFHRAALSNSLSYRFLLREVSRYLTHGLTDVNLYDKILQNTDKPVFTAFRDFIPRYTTSSVIVVQGIKGDEAPELTTMWTILGSPLCTVTTPVWLNSRNIYPSILIADETGNAKLCEWSLNLKRKLFPVNVGEGNDYINLAALISANEEGILQKTLSLEDRILNDSDMLIREWRKEGIDMIRMERFYNRIDEIITESYRQNF